MNYSNHIQALNKITEKLEKFAKKYKDKKKPKKLYTHQRG